MAFLDNSANSSFKRNDSWRRLEERLTAREDRLANRLAELEKEEERITEQQLELKRQLKEVRQLKEELLEKLEAVSHFTSDEAKNELLKQLDRELIEEKARRIKETEVLIKETVKQKAKELLIDAMQKGVTDYVPDYTISVIRLPDEEMKGRIIGREGRNIRAFEQATGVDVDLDEEGVIRLSSFDSVRREIARVALKRLIRDTRIQPVRIEEVVGQTKKEIDKIIYEEGEKLCHQVGVYDLPADKISLLGRFKYRFSYGQNMIAHTLEETKIGIALAQELGADVNTVRLGCLLHDIGKVITDKEGNHVQLGVDLLKKNNLADEVIACVAEHHEDKPFSSLESIIVYIADAVSGSRPGARFEDYHSYVKRLRDLEEIAREFKAVKEAYALQAGRELRIIVNPEKIGDAQLIVLVREIAQKIKEHFKDFPGQINVTAIREMRASAKA